MVTRIWLQCNRREGVDEGNAWSWNSTWVDCKSVELDIRTVRNVITRTLWPWFLLLLRWSPTVRVLKDIAGARPTGDWGQRHQCIRTLGFLLCSVACLWWNCQIRWYSTPRKPYHHHPAPEKYPFAEVTKKTGLEIVTKCWAQVHIAADYTYQRTIERSSWRFVMDVIVIQDLHT